MTLQEVGGLPAGLSREEVRAVRLWCRQRAEQQLRRAHEIEPFWLGRVAHAEVRYRVGLTVAEYARARQWLDRAADRCTESADYLGVHEALRAIADEHVDLIVRCGFLKEKHTHEQIRVRLGVTERDLDVIVEWWRDAVDAVKGQRPGLTRGRLRAFPYF